MLVGDRFDGLINIGAVWGNRKDEAIVSEILIIA